MTKRSFIIHEFFISYYFSFIKVYRCAEFCYSAPSRCQQHVSSAMSLSTVGFKFSTTTSSTGEYTGTICWHNALVSRARLPVSFKHFPLLHYKLQAALINFFFNKILVVCESFKA